MDVRQTRSLFPERGQRKLEWFRPLDAASFVKETELKSLLSKVSKLFRDTIPGHATNLDGTDALFDGQACIWWFVWLR